MTYIYKRQETNWRSYLPCSFSENIWEESEQKVEGLPFDMLLVKPTHLANELNGFSGNFLYGIESAYGYYLDEYHVKCPYGLDMNVESDDGWMMADFDTPWSPPKGELFSLLSQRHECEITHYYCEEGMGYCGYEIYKNGMLVESANDQLKYEEDEEGYDQVVDPDYIIDNVAHFGG
ncbi:hypothetical protein Xentx_03523 [Xenorhabdus thuongxuanensis]|uniref:Uncharacterized protein n=2 Tax=Xenorhabdus thuongxuanensis TaxID=1873484 RepID=A0A1Q5TK05_9GAMM|nr:hypothetical protein Xentx_03523 [Xenorhabdus thuongxuanensis]